MKSPVDKLLNKHDNLIHSDGKKVQSHTQRDDGEWILHTIMIEGCDAPFKFRRTKKYKSLKGQQVNLTYYPDSESVAGFEIEVMRVVRIKQH
ncbi:hypothetical protein [Photobacterium sanguinicancri]|uniref:Uncharacterized protein n=1 Tax=Photobacterium sanguinicancri TaxID=875932 RepID=A0AAW7Y9N7_9GAMM|nr:hypothetical protein [Photobacterium sanguinicancri]KXI22239.1 hypothetical protein AS132_15070 [Photobacterium sanguinicancri]MDO6544259.1 hypothetical protein [Photobacterium sanguinicancri]OZS43070.1 hypothetical protein ASV53_15135 [Photobacterium sanguinicancri]